jgi:hypothetical protein
MIFVLKTPDFHEKCRFFALFQNQSKVIGHLFCNFAADLADGACFARIVRAGQAPLNQI